MDFDLVKYLRTEPVLALVGATNQSSKFGSIILNDMVSKNFTVVPINRKATTVAGLPAYPDLEAASKDHEIGLVVYVVPPSITLESLREADRLGMRKVWIQPGAGDEEVRQFLDEKNFEYLMNACVMVEAV